MPCARCDPLPASTTERDQIGRWLERLQLLATRGHYYRQDGNRTDFDLYQCPQCGAWFESAHHYYSDPESTMGMGRDESEWFDLERLSGEQAKERLQDLRSSGSPEAEAVREGLALLGG